MANPSYWSQMDSGTRALIVFIVIGCFVFISACIFAWWRSPRMRLSRLGGVTTLERNLSYPCTPCRESMEVGEKVRTLSCDHVFHCGSSAKCERDIDEWLLTARAGLMPCPICRRVPHPVQKGKLPPSSPPPQTSDDDGDEDEDRSRQESPSQ